MTSLTLPSPLLMPLLLCQRFKPQVSCDLIRRLCPTKLDIRDRGHRVGLCRFASEMAAGIDGDSRNCRKSPATGQRLRSSASTNGNRRMRIDDNLCSIDFDVAVFRRVRRLCRIHTSMCSLTVSVRRSTAITTIFKVSWRPKMQEDALMPHKVTKGRAL